MEPTSPLWSAPSQSKRLMELTAKTSEPIKEAPLRRDVRSLGILLGRVLVEQAGTKLFDTVERLRRLLIQHREQAAKNEGSDALLSEAKGEVASLDVALAYRVTKAFAAYFELTNLAETNHRKRRRRAAELHTDEPPLPGSFRGTLLRMKQAGVTLEQALAALGETEVQPVFTAHPTEITRRAVLLKRRRIAAELEKLDRLPLPDVQAQACEDTILADITALWQTDEVRLQKLTVIDEIRTGISYYVMTVFDAVPKIYEGIAADFREVYGAELDIVVAAGVLALRVVDRRRPRRQSVRYAGEHAGGAGAGAGDGAVALHARGSGAGEKANGFVAPDSGIGGVARAAGTIRRDDRRAGGGVVAHATLRGVSPAAGDNGCAAALCARRAFAPCCVFGGCGISG